ncbi:MAG: methyltransferase domain-containing protein [Bacteroidales bacterium]|jgi:SAM-dependent methyltransferase|nr:methyltransferase domain-containing protein [Bacteroidales bacterium]
MKMTTATFLKLFEKELDENQNLYPYYKLNKGSVSQKDFRKAYFLQRLNFIEKHVEKKEKTTVLDCGCGYGTTAFFLSLNNIHVVGTTLEFYFEQIDNRKKYWNNFGNIANVTFEYQDIFESNFEENSFDYIILQDTLHHIEPVKKAIQIFFKLLKKGGKIILVEENGACFARQAILFAKRRNKRIIEYFDTKLQKTILFGNENIRTENEWKKLFEGEGFTCLNQETNYIRYYSPFAYKNKKMEEIIEKEQKIANHNNWLRHRFFFGINMVFTKK